METQDQSRGNRILAVDWPWVDDPQSYHQLNKIRELRIWPKCPRCGSLAEPIYIKGINAHKHECCGLESWEFKPLVTRGTLDARRCAHTAFDRIWKAGYMSRSNAYAWLARTLGMKKSRCHMALMTEQEAREVERVSMELLAERAQT